MVILTGKFDGKGVTLDQVPKDLAVNTPVKVIVASDADNTGLDAIVGIAKDIDLPPDFASQHEHYTKGTPKR